MLTYQRRSNMEPTARAVSGCEPALSKENLASPEREHTPVNRDTSIKSEPISPPPFSRPTGGHIDPTVQPLYIDLTNDDEGIDMHTTSVNEVKIKEEKEEDEIPESNLIPESMVEQDIHPDALKDDALLHPSVEVVPVSCLPGSSIRFKLNL
jgi:hypothetical protein